MEALRPDSYWPSAFYEGNSELRAVIDLIREGFFSRGDTTLFRSISDGLMNCDTYMLFADFQSYVDCQSQVAHAYQNARHWGRMFDPQRSPLRPLLLGPHDSRIR